MNPITAIRLALIAVDLFAGGGGASEGISDATGVPVAVAVNHDPAAIEMHAANHPNTLHLTNDVYAVLPFRPGGRHIDILWASPDCTHHSRARGGKPRSNKRRGLAGVVVEWARAVHPTVICVENVSEFADWGPLDADDRPIASRKGESFREWVAALRLAGYRVDWRVLSAADYGAPTSRRRLFIVATSDGVSPAWPEPTHGPGRALPWRTAAECIDWTIPCPSIFDRARPLAEATQRRIAEGIRRYVLTGRPFLVGVGGRAGQSPPTSVESPLGTVTAKADRALVAPVLVQTGYGERDGQAPRVLDLHAPLGAVVAGGQKHALVAAFLAKHNGSGETWNAAIGSAMTEPVHTVTGTDTKALVAAHLTKFYGTCAAGQPLDAPAPTVTAGGDRGGGHAGLVAAFLTKFYGSSTGQNAAPGEPLDTVTCVDRFGLVTVTIDGEPWVIADIGMRMLQPRELARAQGFPDSYVLTGSKREQVARIGNSVCPPVARAVVAAQLAARGRREAA